MTYKITREHKITLRNEDGKWSYQFEADVFGTVTVRYIEHNSSGDNFREIITVPKNDIQTFIDTLGEFKRRFESESIEPQIQEYGPVSKIKDYFSMGQD